MPEDPYSILIRALTVKRRVFVSYHHGQDAGFYAIFSSVFSDTYEIVQDNSVEGAIESEDAEYVISRIREQYLTGSSCTIVLCGLETPRRKFVDWEIKATLDKQHALIGVKLPQRSAYRR